MTVSPKNNLWMIQDKFAQVASISTVHQLIIAIAFMYAIQCRCMMPYNNNFVIFSISQYCFKISYCSLMAMHCVSRTQLSKAKFIITNDSKIIHHITQCMKCKWIAFITVSPQCCTNECYIINDLKFLLKEIDVWKLTIFITQVLDTGFPITMIKFVIACNYHNMRELKTTAFHKVTET